MPRPRVLLVVGVVSALAVAAYTVLAPSALPRLVQQRKSNEALQRDVQRQQDDNRAAETDVAALQQQGKGGDDAMEKAARRELGFVKKDEVVLTGLPVGTGATPAPTQGATPGQPAPAAAEQP